MIRLLLLISFLLCSIHAPLYGQYIPPNRSDLKLIKNLEDFVSEAMPWLEDQSAKAGAINTLESDYNRIQNLLEWNPDSGYLIRVRVETSVISGASTPMSPEFLGLGEQPLKVLTHYYSNPQITTAPSSSPTMRLDNSKSFYVWVENKNGFMGLGKKKLRYGLIPGEFYASMNKEALRISSNNDLRRAFKINHRSHLFEGVMSSLKKQATNSKTKKNLLELEQNIATTQNSIRAIKADLNKTLDEINRTNKALETVRTLQTIVSVATLTMQVQSALQNAPNAGISNAKTADELIEITESYKHDLKNQTMTYEKRINTNMSTYSSNREKLDQILKTNNAPSELTTEIFLY
ncbi:hypothetical protein [Zhouia amylolytica]|uniref:Uncharacterized protein n=1 Tax=Zhouia amylolytica AD3 TaxID=1286632 RepID=W2UPN1_9FLAO|nr:hypothetical protein [Zhouia amylolytica]ETN96145.1 hypothetical protein P278_09460 [Zhouia amylolytica AD3]